MESLFGFVTVFDLTGEGIENSNEIYCIYVGLELNQLVGIGSDGASAMACKFKGVQACIRKKYPMAHYTQCSSHSSNVVIGKANIIVINNTFSNLSHIISFFHWYLLREEKLRCAIQAVCLNRSEGV